MTTVIAHQHVFFIAETGIIAVLNPLLLNELKLAGKARIQRHEDHAALLGVGDGLVLPGEATIREAPAGNAATVDEPAIEAESVAGMNPAYVRAHGTACSLGIRGIGEVRAAAPILGEGRIGIFGRKLERRSVPPPANEFGGEFFFASRVNRRLFLEIVAKRCEVLVQLTIDHE